MTDIQQAQLEQAITALAAMAQAFAGTDQFVSTRLASTRHDLQQHLAAEKWNAWTQAKQAASQRRHFLTRHKAQKGATRIRD
jgi:hypothetical protein